MVISAESAATDEESYPISHLSKPSLRLCRVDKNELGSCGFHLTRTKWDPYPWIAGVDEDSPAQAAGFKVGDCVLEVNGEDVLGLKVSEIASKVQLSANFVSMLLWNAGSDLKCDSESLCCTPMPTSLSRLSSCLSSILSFLECPICFEIISPPAHQCPLGHIICFRCRVCIERCPVCRTNFTRERSLLADQIYNSIIEAFHLKEQSTSERTTKLWERILGRGKRRERNTHSSTSTPKLSRASDLKKKFITRLIGKATSVDNLSSESNFTQPLRKKSISSTDVYTESLRRFHRLNQSSYPSCSSESLLHLNELQENGNLTNKYLFANSYDALDNDRSLPYYFNTPLNRDHHNKVEDDGNPPFHFSSDTTENNNCRPSAQHRFNCPLSEICEPLTATSLLTQHLPQQHDGPIIQFFKSRLTINFPFSLFGDGAIIIVRCYEMTFFLRLSLDEANNIIKLYVWLLGSPCEAEKFRLEVNTNAAVDFRCDNLKFTTTVCSIQATEQANNEMYKYRFVIAASKLHHLHHVQDQPYALNLHFKKVEVTT